MTGILGAITSHNGIVIVSDAETDQDQSTAALEINQNCVAVVFRGKDEVKDFLDKHIIPKNTTTALDTINLVQSQIKIHSAEYAKSNFSFFIAGYEGGRAGYFAIWFKMKN